MSWRSCHSPTGRSGRTTTARSSAIGWISDMRWTRSACPRQYGTSKIRTSPPTSAASWSAPAWFVRSVRPITNRSGRSQNVSPPSIVPGASIRPIVGMPWASVHASIGGGLDPAVGLAGPQRDRAAVRDQERVEGVQRGPGCRPRHRAGGRSSRASSGARRTPRARASRPRGRPGGGSRGRDPRRPARTRARRLDQRLPQRRGHALAAERRVCAGVVEWSCGSRAATRAATAIVASSSARRSTSARVL